MTIIPENARQGSGPKVRRFLVWAGVVLLQLFLTQFITFFAAFFFPSTGEPEAPLDSQFVIILGLTFSAAIILGGLAAIKFHWIAVAPKPVQRSIGALVGAYVPLILSLLIYHPVPAGNPFILVSILAGIFCFWIIR